MNPTVLFDLFVSMYTSISGCSDLCFAVSYKVDTVMCIDKKAVRGLRYMIPHCLLLDMKVVQLSDLPYMMRVEQGCLLIVKPY